MDVAVDDAGADCAGLARSGLRSCQRLLQTRIGGQRIVDRQLLHHVAPTVQRQRIIAVEVPVRKVGSEQQQLVTVDMLHDAFDIARGWRIERLHRHPHMLAHQIRQANG